MRSPLLIPASTLLFALAARPLQGQDIMVGTRWTVHQQDRDSTSTWTFLDGGKLASDDATSGAPGAWRWKGDSIEVILHGKTAYVGTLISERLGGLRDQGKGDEGWWYADQSGGPSVAPEGLVDADSTGAAAPARDSASGASAAPEAPRRRFGLRRRGASTGSGTEAAKGAGFRADWGEGQVLLLRFGPTGEVNFGWVRAGAGMVRSGKGTWQRVQRQVVVRVEGPGGGGLVLRGEPSLAGIRAQATLADGSTRPILLRRVRAGARAGSDSTRP